MMSYYRLGWSNPRVIAGLIFIGMALFSWETVQAAPQYTIICESCHTMPPKDSLHGTRDPDTGAFKGNHQTHAGTTAVTCVKCHGTELTLTGHRDKKIQVQDAINGGTFNNLVFHNQTSVPVVPLGTCSTVNCHFEKESPAWGSDKLGSASLSTCDTCHVTSKLGNAHSKHFTQYGSSLTVCVKCHTDHSAEASPFAHATSAGHAGRTISVITGSYVAASGYFLPSQSGLRTSFGTCSTSYCHSSGQSADGTSTTPVYAATAPNWGGDAACGSCHATTGMTTGSHSLHLAINTISCGKCHTNATATTYSPSTTHVDGNIDVAAAFAYAKQGTPGNGYSTCTTTVCHGGATVSTPVWGVNTDNVTCTKCHGTKKKPFESYSINSYAPSDASAIDTGKVSTNSKTGAHQTHLLMLNGLSTAGTILDRCQNCHGTLPVSGNHATGSSTPLFQGLATKNGAMSPAFDSNNANCSNTYCHNPAGTGGTLNPLNAGTSTTPIWTDATYIDSTLKNEINCNRCHKSPGNPDFVPADIHKGYTIANTSCTPCHGHEGGGPQHINGTKNVNAGCNTCHGYPPMSLVQLSARTGSDFADAKLENYSSGAGYHSSHLAATVKASDGFAPCLPCHPSDLHNQGSGVLRDNVNINALANTGYLFDGTRDKRYDRVATTCSNISCHFKPSPAWKL